MLDQSLAHGSGLRVKRAAPLSVERLVIGKSAHDAAELLPRIFNLCPKAQGAAAHLAFGLPVAQDTAEQIRTTTYKTHSGTKQTYALQYVTD